jgi:hypothetical protein
MEKGITNNNISEEKVTKIVTGKLKHAVPAAVECWPKDSRKKHPKTSTKINKHLHQSTYLYLTVDREPTSYQVVSDFRLLVRYFCVLYS